jgi:hypothetical protein
MITGGAKPVDDIGLCWLAERLLVQDANGRDVGYHFFTDHDHGTLIKYLRARN